MRWNFLRQLTAVGAVIALVSAGLPRVLAAEKERPSASGRAGVANLLTRAKEYESQFADKVEQILPVLNQLRRLSNNMDRHARRLVALYQAGKEPRESRQQALAALGVSWRTDIHGDGVSKVLMIDGRALSHTRMVYPRRARIGLQPSGLQQPDGAEASQPVDELDDEVDAAIAQGEADIAYNEASADELEQTEADLEQWMSENPENPGVPCDLNDDTDTTSTPTPCFVKAAEALVAAVGGKELLKSSAVNIRAMINTLWNEFMNLKGLFAGGLIGWGSVVSGVAEAIAVFVGGLNLSWIAGIAAVGLSAWYLYEFIGCVWPAAPEALAYHPREASVGYTM